MRLSPCFIYRKSYKIFGYLLVTIGFCALSALALGADAAFERIRQSLPQREAGWTIIEADGPHTQNDGSRQASFVWTKGSEEVSATAVLYGSLKAAKGQFKGPRKGGSSMDGFLVDGIGDEAFLFPPVIQGQAGPFNLIFRKARYVIWMTGGSKDTIVRCAKHIASF